MSEINIKNLPEILKIVLKSGEVPFLLGQPSSAKSSFVAQYADNHNLVLIDLRLSQLEPYDLNGLIHPTGKRLEYLPPINIPIEGDVVPKGKNGWLLFLDEITQADESLHKAALKLIYDKAVGSHPIHKDCHIVLAGNRAEDNAGSITLNTTFINKVVTLPIAQIESHEWLQWAYANKVDTRITSCIEVFADNLNTFDPDSTQPYASPRSYVSLSNMIKDITLEDHHLPMIEGAIGKQAAIVFLKSQELLNVLPSYKKFLKNKKKYKDLQVQHGLISLIVNNFKEKDLPLLIKAIKGLDLQIQVIIMKRLRVMHPNISSKKETVKWITKSGSLL